MSLWQYVSLPLSPYSSSPSSHPSSPSFSCLTHPPLPSLEKKYTPQTNAPPQTHRSYRNLSTKTRLLVGVGIITYALAGQYISDAAETKFGYTPTEAEKERLERVMPRIRVLDKE